MTREQMFYERCQELGATDTDIIKHALEDQERLRVEFVPLSLRAETAERALAQLREGLQALQERCSLHGSTALWDVGTEIAALLTAADQ